MEEQWAHLEGGGAHTGAAQLAPLTLAQPRHTITAAQRGFIDKLRMSENAKR